MNFLNKLLCITVFFTIGSLSARAVGTATAPYSGGTEYTGAVEYTLAQERDNIKKQNVFKKDANGFQVFLPNFVLSVQEWVKRNIPVLQAAIFEMLLHVARDSKAEFIGNDSRDLQNLDNIHTQINNLVKKYPNNQAS